MEDNKKSDSKYNDALSRLKGIKQALKSAKNITDILELMEEFRSLYSGIPLHLIAEAGLNIDEIKKSCDEAMKNIKDQLTIPHSQENDKLIKADPEEIKITEDIKIKMLINIQLARAHLNNEEVKANTRLSSEILADAQAGRGISSEKADEWAKKYKTQREGDSTVVSILIEHPTEEEKKAQREEEERLVRKWGHEHDVVKKYKTEWSERNNELDFERGKLAYRLETQHGLMSDPLLSNTIEKSLRKEGMDPEAERKRIRELFNKLNKEDKADSLLIEATKGAKADKALKDKVDKIVGLSNTLQNVSSSAEVKTPSPTPKFRNPKSPAKGY